MYTKQETTTVRKNFWTSFGQYMRPLRGAGGEEVNWLNYKTGISQLYFRMDVDRERASIGIELRNADPVIQLKHFAHLQQLKIMLEEYTGEEWQWQLHVTDDDGNLVSRVFTELKEVNIFRKEDWPAIISFLKQRMLALDEFWEMTKDGFDQGFN